MLNLTFEEKKLRKMYLRQNQLSLVKYARKVHGEYVVNTTEECDAQYNRKCIHSVVQTSLKVGWDVDSIKHVIDFLPFHCWNSAMVPPKYPQTVTLKFDCDKMKTATCVLRADQKSYVSAREQATKQLLGRQWIDKQGIVLTRDYLEIPQKLVVDDFRMLVEVLETPPEDGCSISSVSGTFNNLKFTTILPNGKFRFFREHGQQQTFAPKECFGSCSGTVGSSSCFTPYMMVDVV